MSIVSRQQSVRKQDRVRQTKNFVEMMCYRIVLLICLTECLYGKNNIVDSVTNYHNMNSMKQHETA